MPGDWGIFHYLNEFKTPGFAVKLRALRERMSPFIRKAQHKFVILLK